MSRNLTLSAALLTMTALALGGCLAQSQIQAKYMDKENDCRNQAEEKGYDAKRQYVSTKTPTPDPLPEPGKAVSPNPGFDQAYVVGAAFSECMNKSGWKVTVPKPPGGPGPIVAGNTTTPPPSGAPGPGGVVALKGNPNLQPSTTQPTPVVVKSVQQQPYGLQQQQPVQEAPAAAPILGPGVQPAPATVFKDATPAPSTYQPARPDGLTAPAYGSGVGRQF